MKKILLAAVVVITVLFAVSCKKEKDTPPVSYAETLKGTIWGGKYYNVPFTSIERPYTISLSSGNLFEWKGGGNTFPGTWTVSGNQITFSFTAGAMNKWSGEINNNGNELNNITIPVPDGFRIINCVKNP
jgi:heat shock protein HslJ